ncbi:MAG: CHAD domain-containing protein [Verrucomicrobiota bacterium]
MQVFANESAALAREKLSTACVEMKRLLDALRDPHHGRVADEIHAIRKQGKILRGGFELFRLKPTAGREIQAIGRLLSGSRDAVSRCSTWRKLDVSGDEQTVAAIAALLEQQIHISTRRPPEVSINWCHARVDAAMELLDSLPARELPERVSKGWKKLQRRARKLCHSLERRNEHRFHEARKALKAWSGAAVFLTDEHPLKEPAPALMEELGDENDLTVLAAWLRTHGFTPRFAPGVWDILEQKQNKLRRHLVKAGLAL